jgi:Glycosyl hydrolase family 81 N-terminal domain
MEGYQYGASARIPLSIVMAIVLSAIVILLSPTQQNTQAQIKIQMQGLEEIDSESHTTIRFPIVHRADFNDPASGIVNLDLFHNSLRFQETSPLGVQPILNVAFPTGAFWTNLVVESAPDGISYPIVTYPLAYKWADSVLQVAYPPMRRLVDSISITDIFNPDVTFGSVEPMKARNIVHFDPLSVTIRFMSSRFDMEDDYDSSSNSKTADTYWESYIVQGSPYVTVKYSNTTPVLTALSTFQSVLCSSLSSATFNDGDNTFQAFDKKNISWTDCDVPSTVRHSLSMCWLVPFPLWMTITLLFSLIHSLIHSLT